MPSVESFFNFFNEDLFPKDYAGYVPSVNITENEDSYSIQVSAPGFEKKDFAIQVEDGVLHIKGERQQEQHTESKAVIRKEFSRGSFSRSFNLVDLVDEEKIDAKYENGILCIELPKNERTKAKKQVKQISIG
jgi:HSP20 family protein